jgi:hypothetical protein
MTVKYVATFTSVDGAGRLGRFDTKDEAVAACLADKPKGENPWGYRYKVTKDFGVYRECAADVVWTG